MTSLETANLLLHNGIACIPVGNDKVPRVQSWRKYMVEMPGENELAAWFGEHKNIALIAGKIHCLDFDEKYERGIYARFAEAAENAGLEALMSCLIRQRTPSGGYHLIWRCDDRQTEGNLKLASKPKGTDKPGLESMIETRGHGGYFLIAPSEGYELELNSFESFPQITAEEHDSLLELARSFDESPVGIVHAPLGAVAPRPEASELTPGDDYDQRPEHFLEFLRSRGWTSVRGINEWRRPGKSSGTISATWDKVPGKFRVFSTSVGLDLRAYTPFAAYTLIDHNGDFSAAAMALRAQGFGGKRAKKPASQWDGAGDPPATECEPDEFPAVHNCGPNGPTEGQRMAQMPMTVWTPKQFFEYVPDASGKILGEGYLSKGEWTSFLGVGGLGKSRLALWLCICQLTNRAWCGLRTNGTPKKALFLSTENGVERWKTDLEKMFSILNEEERATCEENLRILALTPEEEGDLNLGNAENIERLVVTLQTHSPEILILDPFADMIDGDENSTSDLVRTLRILRQLHRRGAPDAAVLVIHHARTGAQNVAQAGDNFAAGNFGRGSKALYSRVRCEIQLAPGDRSDPNKLVVACGKSNNAVKFESRGIIFDPENFTYSVDSTFDAVAWRADVNRDNSGELVSFQDCALCALELVKFPDTETDVSRLVDAIEEATGAAKRTIKRKIADSVKNGYLEKPRHGFYSPGPKALVIQSANQK